MSKINCIMLIILLIITGCSNKDSKEKEVPEQTVTANKEVKTEIPKEVEPELTDEILYLHALHECGIDFDNAFLAYYSISLNYQKGSLGYEEFIEKAEDWTLEAVKNGVMCINNTSVPNVEDLTTLQNKAVDLANKALDVTNRHYSTIAANSDVDYLKSFVQELDLLYTEHQEYSNMRFELGDKYGYNLEVRRYIENN